MDDSGAQFSIFNPSVDIVLVLLFLNPDSVLFLCLKDANKLFWFKKFIFLVSFSVSLSMVSFNNSIRKENSK